MGIIGAAINLCSVAATDVSLTGITRCFKTGYKVIDKLMVPVGVFCISSCVGDKVEEHTVNKVKSYKADIKELKELMEENRRLNEEIKKKMDKIKEKNIVHNVFEDQDIVEETEEVTDNGNS